MFLFHHSPRGFLSNFKLTVYIFWIVSNKQSPQYRSSGYRKRQGWGALLRSLSSHLCLEYKYWACNSWYNCLCSCGKCLRKFSGITQSCLCFLKKQENSWCAVLSEQQECFYATFLLLLSQGFPGTLHDTVTHLRGQDYFPSTVVIKEERGWCLLFLLHLPTLHFLPTSQWR